MKTITHNQSSRPWAGKRFQHLYGRFVLDSSGIYLSSDVSDEHRLLVLDAISGAPPPLLELAIRHELTLNVSNMGGTLNENVCTIYANWDTPNPSPHVEVGRSAFGDNLRPFLVHELCHLWWRTCSLLDRERYVEFLKDSTKQHDLEVTEYAHGKFASYLQIVFPEDSKHKRLHPHALQLAQKVWVEESFCETAAKLSVPTYKDSEDWSSTVDLGQRRSKIDELIGLSV